MQISVKADVKKLTKSLTRIQKKQIPFATALALTRTAKQTAIDVGEDTKKYLDRPTPFTQRGFRFIKANKRTLTAVVLAKTIQEKYLKYAIHGGESRPKGKSHVIPYKDYSRNKYGNIPRGGLKRRLAKQNIFSATIGGVPGIWERSKGGKLKLLYGYENVTRYRPIFPFQKRVAYHANKMFGPQFIKALDHALATAR